MCTFLTQRVSWSISLAIFVIACAFPIRSQALHDLTWQFVAAPMGDQGLYKIYIDPVDDNLWYVTSGSGGLYITRDGGNTWENHLAGLTWGFAIDPTNPNRAYAGSWKFGSFNDLYQSTDKGLTWSLLKKFQTDVAIYSILVSSTDSSVLVGMHWGGSASPNGVYKTSNYGNSWNFYPFNIPPLSYNQNTGLITWDMEHDPVNNIIYVATEVAGKPPCFPGCYDPPTLRSQDGGQTWQDVSGNLGSPGSLSWHATKIQVHPTTQEVFFLVEGGSVYLSQDFGDSWGRLGLGFSWDLIIDKNYPVRFFGGGINQGVYLSTDTARSFRPVGPSAATFVSGVALNSASSKIYACNPTGIYVADLLCRDNDGDGYGDPENPSCGQPELDCDDSNPAVNPGRHEGPYGDPTCSDSVDNDCDGRVDAADSGCCNDADGDGYGHPAAPGCSIPGWTDCDDANPAVHPGAKEGPAGDFTCTDGIDNDCDGLVDECSADYYTREVAPHAFIGGGTAMSWRAFDQCWAYALPFTFPYFQTSYGSVYVCANGFLDFTSSNSGQINSAAGFMSRVVIAPLWTRVQTNYTDQNDIYIHQPSADTVVIRWDGRSGWHSGVVVNVEVILYEDGRIQFNYGDGNDGFDFGFVDHPTIGISKGDGSFYYLSPHNGQTVLTNANSDRFTAVGLIPITTPTNTATPTNTNTPTPSFTHTPTRTSTPTATQTHTPTNTATTTATLTPSDTAISTPTPCSCVGDCNCNGGVTVDEILTMVNIALGNTPVTMCEAGDANHDLQITVDEILTAVNNALNGCA